MIARTPDQAPLVHARHDGPVSAGDALRVDAGDVAFVVREGMLLRVLPAGSYTVPAEFAGPGVEMHFVSTRPRMEVRFGGPLGPGMPARAVFGTLSYRVADPERFVIAHLLDAGADTDRYVGRLAHRAAKDAIGRNPALAHDSNALARGLREGFDGARVGLALDEVGEVRATV